MCWNMGLHDYGAILFNPESEQSIIGRIEKTPEPPLSDDAPLTLEVWDDMKEEDQRVTLEKLLAEDPDQVEEIMSSFSEDIGVGQEDAYLLLQGEAAQKGRTLSFFLRVEYSWDDWDFYLDVLTNPMGIDDSNDTGYLYLNYREATDGEMSPTWEMPRKILEYLKPFVPGIKAFTGKVKVTNLTPRSYEIIVDDSSLTQMLNEELIYAARMMGLSLQKIAGLTRREVFNLLKRYLFEKIGLDEDEVKKGKVIIPPLLAMALP